MAEKLTAVLPYAPPSRATLPSFDSAWVAVLHLVTGGLFSAVWFNRMHGLLPRTRPDDPSAGIAIGFLFLPIVNIYWLFFTYLRLCDRIDEARHRAGLPVRSLKTLMTLCCICMLVPYVNLITLFTLQPALFALMQERVNDLTELPADDGMRV